MEKNDYQYDPDEILIRNALGSVHTQDFDILKGVEEKMKKRGNKLRIFTVAFIAATLIGTTAVAAQFLGSFDRLEEIIGPDDAAMLVPIEIATVHEGQSVSYGDIRAELVAVGVFGNIVDVYFTLEDTVSNRLEGGLLDRDLGEFQVDATLRPYDIENFPEGAMMGSFGGIEIIHEDENGKLTLRLRHNYGESVAGQQLVFRINDIIFDVHDIQNHHVSVDLADFAHEAPSMLYQYENASGFQGDALFVDGEFLAPLIEERIREEGILVLNPHELNIHNGIEQANIYVSSIGAIDGKLHVQLYYPDRLLLREQRHFGNAFVRLFRGDPADLADPSNINWDDMVFSYLEIRFDIDEDGNLYQSETGISSFQETIFDIDLANIHEYTLLINFFGYQDVRLEWEVTFDTDDHYRQLEKIAEIDIPMDTFSLAQININPFGILLAGEGTLPEAVFDENTRTIIREPIDFSMYVHTTDGVIIPSSLWGDSTSLFSINFSSWEEFDRAQPMPINGRFIFDSMIDLDSVLFVEINGQQIVFE